MPEEFIPVSKIWLSELHETLKNLKTAALNYEESTMEYLPAEFRTKIENCVILDQTLEELFK